jgi:hypothetical protein
MKDTMSLLLAAAILAAGGLGLYMVKSPDDEQKGGEGEEYNEDSLFGSGSFWGSNKSDDDVEKDFEEDYYEPKVRSRGGKTKRNRKSSGTKRRYY